MKVLLVEDEKLIRVFIVEYFTKQGATVVEASDGYEALSLLDETYDIVLLDIMMPGIDGYEVCRMIRQKNDVPILFISALSEDENKLKGYDVGADDFISKPFTPSLLYAKCNALLLISEDQWKQTYQPAVNEMIKDNQAARAQAEANKASEDNGENK